MVYEGQNGDPQIQTSKRGQKGDQNGGQKGMILDDSGIKRGVYDPRAQMAHMAEMAKIAPFRVFILWPKRGQNVDSTLFGCGQNGQIQTPKWVQNDPFPRPRSQNGHPKWTPKMDLFETPIYMTMNMAPRGHAP